MIQNQIIINEALIFFPLVERAYVFRDYLHSEKKSLWLSVILKCIEVLHF